MNPILDGLIMAERQRVTDDGSARLERDLEDAMKAMRNELERALEEIDEEPPPGILEGSNALIVIAPQKKRMELGSRASLTVFTRRSEPSVGASSIKARISAGPDGAIEVHVGPERRVHDREPYEVSTITVNALELGSCILEVKDLETGASTEATIVIEAERLRDEKEPTKLEWKTPRMTVAPGNQRHAILQSPARGEGSRTVSIGIEGTAVSMEQDECRLEMNAQGWLEGSVTLAGTNQGESSELRASDADEGCDAVIDCKAPFKLGDPSTQIRIDREFRSTRQGELRASPSGWELTIYALHPALADLLGDLDATTGEFENEGRPEVRVRFAEAMTAGIVDLLMAKEWASRPDADEFADPEAVMATRDSKVAHWLPQVQRILLSQGSAN
jgi:hypothetical protein